MNLTVHNVYFCFSEVGCTISLMDGTRCKDVPAHTPTLFVAQQSDMVCSDPAAVVREIPNGLQLLHGQMMKEQAAGGLPAGFKRVEYLESTGKQRITTNLKSALIEEIELEVIGYGKYVLMQVGYETLLNQSDSVIRIDLGAYCPQNEMGRISTGKNIVTFSFKTYTLKINNAEKVVTQNTGNEKFFAENQYWFSKDDLSWSGINTALGNCKISKDNKTHLDIIPCLDDTGAPCMYDLVSKKAFYNSGTGDFTYPTETATYSLRRVLPDWGKLTKNGLRRLYHAPANYTGGLYDYALETGYKPIVETEQPEEGYWTPRWTETEEEIVLEWIETEPPLEEFGLPMPEEST